MTEDEIKQHQDKIDKMNQIQMARLYRFAPAGHVYFNSNYPLYEYFMARFSELGGMTTSISKGMGWKE